MAESREERMQQRMRGAGRHEVADDSFGFILPVAEASPEIPPPGPANRTEPNTSAKRRRLSPVEEPEAPTPTPVPAPRSTEKGSSASRSSARLSASRAQSSPAPPPQPQPQPPSASSQVRSSASRTSARLNPPRPDPHSLSEGAPSVADVLEAPQVQPTSEEAEPEAGLEDDGDELEFLPAAAPVPGSQSSIISRGSTGPAIVEEEVTESPVEAPGSGHRRRIRFSSAATQSARLQRAVMEEENGFSGEFTTSSPLARKTRTSTATATSGLPSARSTRASARIASSPSIQDLSSPSARPLRKNDSTAATGGESARSPRSQDRRSALSTVLGAGDDEADELSSPLAAGTSSARKPPPKVQKTKAKPKKKPPPKKQPEPIEEEEEEVGDGSRELGADADDNQEAEAEDQDAEAEEIDVHEAAQRIGHKRPRPSPPREESPELNADPAEKAEPARKKRQKRPLESPAKQAQPKVPKKKPRKSTAEGRGGGGREAIPIIVQRYTKPLQMNEDDSDADILGADIPFANRGGVNVIDVLAQMCDEVIESNLETLHKATSQAADSATRKEYRTKLRALEAFQEELRTRLLEHTIALDTMHALKKRVRSVQKEKLALRSEILRIRAEREQVALKMDAVRIKHERESKESLHLLGLSSAMHDIELAVDNGRSAPDLGPKEKKAAELANLELLVSRVADEASTSGGDGGGNLKQIKDFNAFLERAAAALEGR